MVQNHRVWEPHAIPPLASHRNQGEMAHTCRGTINLFTAHFDTEDSCGIVLTSGGQDLPPQGRLGGGAAAVDHRPGAGQGQGCPHDEQPLR